MSSCGLMPPLEIMNPPLPGKSIKEKPLYFTGNLVRQCCYDDDGSLLQLPCDKIQPSIYNHNSEGREWRQDLCCSQCYPPEKFCPQFTKLKGTDIHYWVARNAHYYFIAAACVIFHVSTLFALAVHLPMRQPS